MTAPKVRPTGGVAAPPIDGTQELPDMPPPPIVDVPASPAPEKNRGGRPKGAKTRPKVQRPPAQDAPPRPPGRPTTAQKLTENLTAQLTMVGMAAMMIPGATYDGAIVVASATDLAVALVAVGETNPKVRKALESTLNASAWGQVATVVLTMVLPILANHAPALVDPGMAAAIGGARMLDAQTILGNQTPEHMRRPVEVAGGEPA